MVSHDALAATSGHRTVTMRDGEIVKDVGSIAKDLEARLVHLERAREDARAGNA